MCDYGLASRRPLRACHRASSLRLLGYAERKSYKNALPAVEVRQVGSDVYPLAVVRSAVRSAFQLLPEAGCGPRWWPFPLFHSVPLSHSYP